jgi:hypothetical protein
MSARDFDAAADELVDLVREAKRHREGEELAAHDFTRDGTVPDRDAEETYGIEDVYDPETFETDDPDVLEAEQFLADAAADWHTLSDEERAAMEQLAEVVDQNRESIHAAEVYAARLLASVEAAGHDLDTFARLVEKHGDTDAALAALNRIGPAKGGDLDDTLGQFFRENRELRG